MNTASTNRDIDFILLCRKIQARLVARNADASPSTVLPIALARPAPSYYADIDYANRVVRYYYRHNALPPYVGKCTQKWLDFIADLRKLLAAEPTVHPALLIARLCTGEVPAPSFYLTMRQARAILRRHNRAMSNR